MIRWFVWLCIAMNLRTLTGCATLAATEAPPCDEATLAAIVASCKDEAECNAELDERQATCTKRIQEDK